MSVIPLLASSPQYSEASQIVPTVNGIIQQINSNALIGSQAPTSLRNSIVGGDFGTNPWQRGTSFTSITNTLTYTADRFWALGGASSSISVSQVTSAQQVGFSGSLQFGRAAANADTTAIKLGYVMADNDPVQMQGQPFVLSFYAKAGANFSAASSVLGVTVGTGTAANGSAANFAAGTWTGYAGVTLIGSTGATATGVTLTTGWQRFSLAGFIPAAALQVGVSFQYTPVGTAGSADWFQITGVQLETVPQGGVNPTPFERLPQGTVLAMCQRYYQQVNEGAASVATGFVGPAYTTSLANVQLSLPVTMRVAPTVTFGGTALSNATFAIIMNSATPIALATTYLVQSALGANTTSTVALKATSSAAFTVGFMCQLVGAGGGAKILISSEL